MNNAQVLRTTYSDERKEEGDQLGRSVQNLTGTVKSLIKELDENVLSFII